VSGSFILKRDPVVLIVVAMVVALMLVFSLDEARDRAGANALPPTIDGKTAPDFTLQTLQGKTVHLSDFRGKAVLLNLWATWCDPCKIEMPWFEELQTQYGSQGLQILGVSMDDAAPSDIAQFAKEMHVDYPILVGKESQRQALAESYGGLQVLPESFYIDRDGKVVEQVLGLRPKVEIEDYIKKTLNQPRMARAEAPK
jgi:peroxiredoxin